MLMMMRNKIRRRRLKFILNSSTLALTQAHSHMSIEKNGKFFFTIVYTYFSIKTIINLCIARRVYVYIQKTRAIVEEKSRFKYKKEQHHYADHGDIRGVVGVGEGKFICI